MINRDVISIRNRTAISSSVHNIDTTWYCCDQPGCGHKTKHSSSIKTHKANIHDINVIWYHCDQHGCGFKAKQSANLKQHKAVVHDIGAFRCQLCEGACGKTTPWTCSKTLVQLDICRKCYLKSTGYKTRVEKQVVGWLQEHFPHPIVRQDRRVQGDACLAYRPDIMYYDGLEQLTIYVEVDEHQHKYGNGSYACDEKRMSDLYDETSGLVVFVRYNPHTYKPPHGTPKVNSGNDRRRLLLRTLENIVINWKALQDEAPLHVIYICYDQDNPNIAQRIPTRIVV